MLERLAGNSYDDQQVAITQIANNFSIPVTLETFDPSKFTPQEQNLLADNLVIAQEPGQSGERYYRLVPDTNAMLKIGPIPFPGIAKVIEPLVLGVTITLFALCSFLWVGPLWRDLRRLITTSNRIADGQLDARVESATTSMIGPVIEGFNRMADQTQNMIASQQALTNAVSHELRTPLARLKFSLEIFSQTDSENLRQRHRDEMVRDLNELNQMVDELLTFVVKKVAEWHIGNAQILDSSLGGAELQINWPVDYSVHCKPGQALASSRTDT